MKKLYIVTWIDAFATHGYYNKDNSYEPIVMKDVGWVVDENEESIVLSRSHCPVEDDWRQLSVIPWVNVVSMEELV